MSPFAFAWGILGWFIGIGGVLVLVYALSEIKNPRRPEVANAPEAKSAQETILHSRSFNMAGTIISFILGVVIFVFALLVNPVGAIQQAVQYLGFVCASIFFAAGLIGTTLTSILDSVKQTEYYAKKANDDQNKK